MTVNSKMAEIIFHFCMCFEIWASGLGSWSVGLYLWAKQPELRICSCFCQTPPNVLTTQKHFLILISPYAGSQPLQLTQITTPKLCEDKFAVTNSHGRYLPHTLLLHPKPRPRQTNFLVILANGCDFSSPCFHSGEFF